MFGLGYGRRLAELEKEVEEMRDAHRRVTDLEADWQDWLHKIRNVLARLNQRTRDQAEETPLSRMAQAPINPAAARLLGIHNGDL